MPVALSKQKKQFEWHTFDYTGAYLNFCACYMTDLGGIVYQKMSIQNGWKFSGNLKNSDHLILTLSVGNFL